MMTITSKRRQMVCYAQDIDNSSVVTNVLANVAALKEKNNSRQIYAWTII
jgi:hypothetical protein